MFLSATNRLAAQHFKAETKQPKWKIMSDKKRKKKRLFSFLQIISELQN